MRRVLAVVLFAALCGTGCLHESRAAKLQESAQSMNMAARFGRMDIAMEHVSPKAIEEFARQHGSWGSNVRIVDLEFQGLRFVDKDRALVAVAVGWQRVDDQELRVTQIAQEWQYDRNNWKLVSEKRTAGDVGLLGEPLPETAGTSRRPDAHFPTVVIR